jgi:hypothetical protein
MESLERFSSLIWNRPFLQGLSAESPGMDSAKAEFRKWREETGFGCFETVMEWM